MMHNVTPEVGTVSLIQSRELVQLAHPSRRGVNSFDLKLYEGVPNSVAGANSRMGTCHYILRRAAQARPWG